MCFKAIINYILVYYGSQFVDETDDNLTTIFNHANGDSLSIKMKKLTMFDNFKTKMFVHIQYSFKSLHKDNNAVSFFSLIYHREETLMLMLQWLEHC